MKKLDQQQAGNLVIDAKCFFNKELPHIRLSLAAAGGGGAAAATATAK